MPGIQGTAPWASYDALRIDAWEVERYASFEEMTASADRVVVGSFRRFAPGRTIQGDAPEDVVQMIEASFEVTENVKGSSPATVVVEFLAPTNDPEGLATAVRSLDDAARAGPSVVFLREKRGSREAGLLRLVNSSGYVAPTDRGPVDTPLASLAARPDPKAPMDPRDKWPSMERFIADLKS